MRRQNAHCTKGVFLTLMQRHFQQPGLSDGGGGTLMRAHDYLSREILIYSL